MSALHKSLLLSIVGTLALTAILIQITAVREAFGIAVPAISDLGIIVGLGLLVTITIEITKLFCRPRPLCP